MRAALSIGLVACVALGGCRGNRDVLRPLPAGAPAVEYSVQIPAGYEVRSAGFGAAYTTSVSGGGGDVPVSGSSAQDAYLSVYAVERATGQEVVLVYGDIRRRPDPVAIIRLQRADARPAP